VPAPSLRLTLLTGRPLAQSGNAPTPSGSLVPLPSQDTARLRSVTVTETDEQSSVFSLTFDAGRSRTVSPFDLPGLSDSPVALFSRVVLELCFGASSTVLMDGLVTQAEAQVGEGPGSASLTVTGEDVSYWLDQEARTAEHPGLKDHELARAILEQWKNCGIEQNVQQPSDSEARTANHWVPTQYGSDLAHLREMADRHGFVAYMIPGPGRGRSTFYWGPPVRDGRPQPALSVDLGPETTVSQLRVRSEALAPSTVSGSVFDRDRCGPVAVTVSGSPQTQLSTSPTWKANAGNIRHRLPADTVSDALSATARAQSEVDRRLDAVTAEGTVDGARYGHVLRPRALVGVRGAGFSNDGLWYVKTVQHSLARGSYQQQVTLKRDGYGSTVQVVDLGSED
jgi:hypothetical protein